MSVGQNLYKVKSPNNFFLFSFLRNKSPNNSKNTFWKTSRALGHFVKNYVQSMGFPRNPTKSLQRSGHTTHQLSVMILIWAYMIHHFNSRFGLFDPKSSLYRFYLDLCTSSLASWTCPCSSSHFEMGLKIPWHLPRGMCWLLKAYFLSMRIRAHNISPNLPPKKKNLYEKKCSSP